MCKAGMRRLTAFCFAAAVIAGVFFSCFKREVYLTFAVTFGTITYHLGIRLLVGLFYSTVMKNQADYNRKWFQIRSWEKKLYQYLKVKNWKDKMPTYNPEDFSVKNHSLHEIAQIMCQSELVHETNMVLSFFPLLAVRWFGAFYVFLLTSIGGALFDGLFVVMQRYNRMRILRILSKKR